MTFVIVIVGVATIAGLVTLGLMSLAERRTYRRRVAKRLAEIARAPEQEAGA